MADAVRVGVERHAARVESLLPLPERFPSPGGLLDLLLAARDDDDQTGMTDQQLRDEVLTLLLAGHETTAIALSWTLWLLWRYPQVEATLCAEVDRVLRGRLPTTDDLPRLAYANHVVTESMRLYPPVWAFGREAVRDCELGGYRVAAGTSVVVSQWVLHRDPRHWRDPERFHPSRWAGGLARRLPPFAYLPFGGGPRRCLGGGFAITEAVLLLAMITQRLRLTLAPGPSGRAVADHHPPPAPRPADDAARPSLTGSDGQGAAGQGGEVGGDVCRVRPLARWWAKTSGARGASRVSTRAR